MAGWQNVLRESVLVPAENHGVNRVDRECDEDPADGGEEEAADDLADGMGGEEAICSGVLISVL